MSNKARLVFEDEELVQRQKRREERRTILVALADKKKAGKLTLGDIDTKLDIILEILEDLGSVRSSP